MTRLILVVATAAAGTWGLVVANSDPTAAVLASALALVLAMILSTASEAGASSILLALAVWLLPAAQRSRYREEFRSELFEHRGRERWKFALRVLADIWQLRRALLEGPGTPDGDVARRAER